MTGGMSRACKTYEPTSVARKKSKSSFAFKYLVYVALHREVSLKRAKERALWKS